MSLRQCALRSSFALLGLIVFAGMPIAAQEAPAPAPADEDKMKGIEEIVVTARKREESIQDIPIAVTAISADDLATSNIDDVADIQFNVPNLNYTKTNFSGAGNLSIRGVGNLATAATSEPGTGIHVNYAPFPGSRIFETEFYDIERVEVLRGPQGTLFGRSSPGGALNVYTRKPEFESFGGYAQVEYGDYNHAELRGALNIPMGEHFASRIAGYYYRRDGITDNLTTGNEIDDRDVYAIRGSFAGTWDDVNFNLMVQYFNEGPDNRSRFQKQACTRNDVDVWPYNTGCVARDPVTNQEVRLGSQPLNYFGTLGYELGALIDSAHVFTGGAVPRYLSGNLGVLSALLGFPFGASPFLDDAQAALIGLPPAGVFGAPAYGPPTELYANSVNPSDKRKVRTLFDPYYYADEFQLTFEVNWDVTENVRLTSVTGYHNAYVRSEQDYWFAEPTEPVSGAPRTWVFPDSKYGGSYPSEFLFDRSRGKDNIFTQELRVASSFDGPFNFTAGAAFATGEIRAEYLVWAAVLEAFHSVPGDFFGLCTFDANGIKAGRPGYAGPVYGGQATGQSCMDLLPQTSYYKNETKPTRADEYGIFGELYFDLTETTTLTLGARYNDIHKTDRQRVNNPFECEWSGDPVNPCRILSYADFGGQQEGGWSKVTWKVSIDQAFDLPFAPDSLVYATVSTGFKGGGFNPATAARFGGTAGEIPRSFDPEEITAYEAGYKGFLFDRLVLNLAGFYYDYEGMQISKIVNRTAKNENVDTKLWGVELETVFQPFEGLQVELNVAWLDTEIQKGSSVDGADPTAGRPGWVVVKQYDFNGQNAVCNPTIQTVIAGAPLCVNLEGANGTTIPDTELDGYVFDGFAKSLKGNELPNAAPWSVKAGLQYAVPIMSGWELTPRVEFFWHDQMYGRFYNDKKDIIDSWEQLDASIRLAQPDGAWSFELWGKNLQGNDDVTGHYFTDPTSANFTNLFILEPRTFGGTIRYEFGGG
jgi:outer membrane receptor protein involved in Fe transport